MASENAKAVAKEVVENLRKGTKVNLGEIIREQGYSESVALHPDIVTETKSFQAEIRPIVEQMEVERQRIIEAMKQKDLSKEEYRTLTDGIDKLTKNIQLLSGGVTDKQQITVIFDESFKDRV